MARALLAALVLTLAAVLATAPAGASAAAAATSHDDAQGWAPRAPGWLDPAPRGRTVATGDGPRAMPRRPLRVLPRQRVTLAPAGLRGPVPVKASLSRLGRRQTDGG
ncbi:MAG: hypothetical protein K0A98_04375 [Trueperaceae bacterium]|nr:hypothetical protein [Trueperaceae bacterium]